MSPANPRSLFLDRADAGRQLAIRLRTLQLDAPAVYALPRGGVPVAVEVARELKAPLDLILVRKIGAPGQPELALAAVVDGEGAQTVINEHVEALTGATLSFLKTARDRELAEIERRRSLYSSAGRSHISPAGRTAIVVDDGLATGATAKAALQALRRRGAAKVILAIPVAPREALEAMRSEADLVICLETPQDFFGVGAFFDDFHQLTDDETIALLGRFRAERSGATGDAVERREVRLPPLGLIADLQIPSNVRGVVVFAHGSGSSRLSPRNRAVADDLNRRGFATLLFDLLDAGEAEDRRKVFDIDLLADRVLYATAWIDEQPALAALPLGLFGASTGAAAALKAAARLGSRVGAVVSRGGRPDLAGPALSRVAAATLLVVGGADEPVIELNRHAYAQLTCDKALKIVPGAGHLFEEPGTLEQVMKLSGDWFLASLFAPKPPAPQLTGRTVAETASSRLAAAAEPLPEIDHPDFAKAFDRYADARLVLLGEASHGTSDFYRARAAITRRLIENFGFEAVAVEADWPDAAAIDRHVRLKRHQATTAAPFSRFPTWMWRNTDVEAFVRWMRDHNAVRPAAERAAFYGLDLYNMRASMAAVLEYLDKVDPRAAAQARERYACLTPWSAEPAAYGRAALDQGYAICEAPVVSILVNLARHATEYAAHDGETFFDAAQNARLVADAERYYRAMYYGSHESWNLRDRHMFDTLEQILMTRGRRSKVVVWAHNSHIGDARYTEMGAAHGEMNIGQLCRERFGKDVALIGFGTNSGSVLAATDWDAPAEVKTVRPSRSDSFEALFHDLGIARYLVDLRIGHNESLRDDLRSPRLERYIGVIYRPESERMSHYAHASLSDQYDGFVWFDESRAITPLAMQVSTGEDETYPFGV